MPDLPDLRDFVRAEPIPGGATLLVRGGPDSVVKLEAHAERVRRAFVLDREPVLGISVFASLDDIGPASLDEILAGKLSSYRVVHSVYGRSPHGGRVRRAADVRSSPRNAPAPRPGPG